MLHQGCNLVNIFAGAGIVGVGDLLNHTTKVFDRTFEIFVGHIDAVGGLRAQVSKTVDHERPVVPLQLPGATI
jgi:hypothetical protein